MNSYHCSISKKNSKRNGSFVFIAIPWQCVEDADLHLLVDEETKVINATPEQRAIKLEILKYTEEELKRLIKLKQRDSIK